MFQRKREFPNKFSKVPPIETQVEKKIINFECQYELLLFHHNYVCEKLTH